MRLFSLFLFRLFAFTEGHSKESREWRSLSPSIEGCFVVSCLQKTTQQLENNSKKRLLSFEQAHFDASRHADEIARVQAATTAMRALGRLPPTRRRPSSSGGGPLGGVALGDFSVGGVVSPAAAAAPAAAPAGAPAGAPGNANESLQYHLQHHQMQQSALANAAAKTAAPPFPSRPGSAAAAPSGAAPLSSPLAPANSSRMAAAPRAVAERAALEMITSLSFPRPGPAIAVGGGWERSPALGEAGCSLVALESSRAVTWALNALGVVAASARPPLDLEAAPESVCKGLLSVMARGIGSGGAAEKSGTEEGNETDQGGSGPPTPGRSSTKRKAAALLLPASVEPPFWVSAKKKPLCCDAVANALSSGAKSRRPPPPWWFAASLAAADDGGDVAAAWGCASASILRNAALTCAASASRLARPDAVSALCGVLEEVAAAADVGSAEGQRCCSPAANEAAADALDILVCAAPSISVAASDSAPPRSALTPAQAARLAEALLALLAPPPLSAKASSSSSSLLPPLRLRIGAARVVAALARGPGAAAAVLDVGVGGDPYPSSAAASSSRRFAAAVAVLVAASGPAEARASLRLDAAGASGPSEVSAKDLPTAALRAAGAALHADAVSSGACALAALLTRRAEFGAGDGRTMLAPGALAAAELVLESPVILRSLVACACGRLPELPRTAAGGAPTGELAEVAARSAGAAADAGVTCLMASVAGRPSAAVVAALAPFAGALAARAVSLPAAASSGRLATNLNSLIGAVEAARLRVKAASG